MGLISNYAEINWNSKTRQWYIDKGYVFTKNRDKFLVFVNDLTFGSGVKVPYICDKCGVEGLIRWCDYNKRYSKNTYCKKCSLELFGNANSIKTKLANSLSFKQWCYDNLDKDKADEIIFKKWNYNKNKCNPDDVLYKSGKKYWFKCIDSESHDSELKYINNFVNGNKGCLNCNQCNSLAYKRPDLIKYLLIREDAYQYSYSSNERMSMQCPDCGHKKIMSINALRQRGFSCNQCGDGISYPEKFVFSMLDQLEIKFILQLSKINFSWCGNYRYDFYLPDTNSIIEVHGNQHYNGWIGLYDIENIQINDNIKYNLALENGVENYIIIDARRSELKWIKDSIINSKLNNIYDLSKIDWNKCSYKAFSNIKKEVCDLWNKNLTIPKIMIKTKLSRTTIIKYLNAGSDIGWCDYSYNHKKTNDIEVVCLNTGELFSSMVEASRYYKCDKFGIGKVCNNKQSFCGKHPITNETLKWMKYNIFINKYKDVIVAKVS